MNQPFVLPGMRHQTPRHALQCNYFQAKLASGTPYTPRLKAVRALVGSLNDPTTGSGTGSALTALRLGSNRLPMKVGLYRGVNEEIVDIRQYTKTETTPHPTRLLVCSSCVKVLGRIPCRRGQGISSILLSSEPLSGTVWLESVSRSDSTQTVKRCTRNTSSPSATTS